MCTASQVLSASTVQDLRDVKLLLRSPLDNSLGLPGERAFLAHLPHTVLRSLLSLPIANWASTFCLPLQASSSRVACTTLTDLSQSRGGVTPGQNVGHVRGAQQYRCLESRLLHFQLSPLLMCLGKGQRTMLGLWPLLPGGRPRGSSSLAQPWLLWLSREYLPDGKMSARLRGSPLPHRHQQLYISYKHSAI